MVLVSNVTAPLSANTLPATVALVVNVIDVKAKMFPTKAEPVPIVAELPTCQNTLQAWAPLVRFTTLLDAVVSVLAGHWKIKIELGLFWPSRVRVPVNPSEGDPV
jgi:hypothetical protein